MKAYIEGDGYAFSTWHQH